MTTETQLRQRTTHSRFQARASSTAEKVLQQQQEAQRNQQVSQQEPQLSQEQIQELVMYPWGSEFSRLPKDIQSKIEQMHQDYIGGAREREFEVSSMSVEKQMQQLAMTGAEKGTLFLPTGKIAPEVITTITPAQTLSDIIKQKQGTYDIKTKVYTSPEGYKQSMATPPSSAIKTGGIYDIIKQKTQYSPTISSETNRYSNLGYSESESKALAKESVKQGGVSFSPERARDIINKVPYSEQIKSEGILPPTIRKVSKVTENILNVVGKVGDIKIGVLSGITGSPRTLGKSASGIVKGIKKVGELSASGYEDMFFKAGISTEYTEQAKNVPIYQRETIMGMGTNVLESPSIIFLPEEKRKTIAGIFIEGGKIAPELILWGVSPTAMAGVQALSSAEELKNINKDTNKILEEQYNEYKLTIPEEGYRLLTKEEFFKENKEQVYNQLKQQALISGGTSLLFLGGSSIWKGIKAVKTTEKKIIQTALEKQYKTLGDFEGIQPVKGKEFNIYGERVGKNIKQIVMGAGKEELGINTGLVYTETRGVVTYKNILGLTKEKGFIASDVSLMGTKVLPKSIKQFGDITKAIVKGGGYPISESLTFFKGGEKVSKVISRLEKGITKVGGKQLSFIESLSQPTKVETITKIRTPEAKIFEIKIIEKPNVIKSIGGKKTSLLDTFQETQQVTKQISYPKVLIPKTKAPKAISSLIESKYPTYVGGTQLGKDLSGLGIGLKMTPEETIINIPLVQQPEIKSKIFTYPELTTIPKSDIQFKELSLETTKTKQETRQEYKQKLIPQIKFDLGLKEQVKEIQKVQPKVILKEMLKQQQKQRPRQIQKQIIRTPTTPKIKVPLIIIPPIPSLTFGEKRTAREQVKELFEVFVKSKGKEVSIGETFGLFKAGKALREKLKSGLEASGYVVKKSTGKKVGFEELAPLLGEEFTAGKRDMFKVVQRRSKRLGTVAETFKIQTARKEAKPKRLKWL